MKASSNIVSKGGPLLLSTVAATLAYWAAGPSLGAFLAGLFFVALLVPPLALSGTGLGQRFTTLLLILPPFWAMWLICLLRSQLHTVEWLACCIILSAWALVLGGLAAALNRLKLAALLASAVVVIAALAWITWPIWLSPTWKGMTSADAVDRLVNIHPGMAMNAQLSRTYGLWTEQSVAYHLTDLSQDVPYRLPASPWPTIALHAGLGGCLLFVSSWRRKSRPDGQTK